MFGRLEMSDFRPSPGLKIHPFDSTNRQNSMLVETTEGALWQVSRETIDVLEALGEAQTLEEVATQLEARWRVPVPVERLRTYLEDMAASTGLVRSTTALHADIPTRQPRRSHLSFRVTLLPARWVNQLARPLAWLFEARWFWPGCASAVIVALLISLRGTLAGAGWLAAIATPQVVALFLVSTLVHELGHASACRRGDSHPGEMGFGLYLIFPVLYVRVDDAWKLSRHERIIVDLGGIYLQLLFGLACVTVGMVWPPFRTTAWATFMMILISIAASANPLLRLDGYWLLSDAIGVPNLRRQSLLALRTAVPTLRGTRGRTDGQALPRWIEPKLAFGLILYALVSIAFFAFFAVRILSMYPEYVGDVYVPLVLRALATVENSIYAGEVGRALMALFQLVLPTAVIVGVPITIARIVWISITRMLHWRVSEAPSSATSPTS